MRRVAIRALFHKSCLCVGQCSSQRLLTKFKAVTKYINQLIYQIIIHGYLYSDPSIKLQSLNFGLLSKQHVSPTSLRHISLGSDMSTFEFWLLMQDCFKRNVQKNGLYRVFKLKLKSFIQTDIPFVDLFEDH